MKKSEAESLHNYLISKWINEEKPERTGEFELLNYYDYLRYAKSLRPDCMDFRCRAGADYEVELWFDYATKQSWTR